MELDRQALAGISGGRIVVDLNTFAKSFLKSQRPSIAMNRNLVPNPYLFLSEPFYFKKIFIF